MGWSQVVVGKLLLLLLLVYIYKQEGLGRGGELRLGLCYPLLLVALLSMEQNAHRSDGRRSRSTKGRALA